MAWLVMPGPSPCPDVPLLPVPLLGVVIRTVDLYRYTPNTFLPSPPAAWFQELQRAVGSRKLEAGFGLAAVGLLLFGGAAVDAVWSARNKGVSGAVAGSGQRVGVRKGGPRRNRSGGDTGSWRPGACTLGCMVTC